MVESLKSINFNVIIHHSCVFCSSSGRATRGDLEIDASVEGSLAAEVSMIVLDVLEHIVQVRLTFVIKDSSQKKFKNLKKTQICQSLITRNVV